MKMFDLSGKVAIITGGNGGIGFGMSKGLSQAGAHVVINGRNREKAEAAVAEIDAAGGSASVAICDIRDPQACRDMVASTVGGHGRVDVLVNNSAINFPKSPQDFTLQEWHDVIDTNLTAPFVLCQAVYPHFLKQGGGKIINIGSIASFQSSPVGVAYSPSKGGILQLTKALAVAWAGDNIQINAILPGWIDTPLSERARSNFPDLEAAVIARTPAGRWGKTDDFAGAAVYLASSASNFVNGAHLVIDGAYSSKA
jgi:2-deoxy-D-gluconate 3-dehydrogenase